MTEFLTASETAREINLPVSKVLAAVESGKLVPAGRAGSARNSALLFLRSDLPEILTAIETGADAATRPHDCKSTGEILEKASALNRACSEIRASRVA